VAELEALAIRRLDPKDLLPWLAPLPFDDLDRQALAVPRQAYRPLGVPVAGVTFDLHLPASAHHA
jgi:hypothetical protein